jgi:Co/Zn/Cd efflux system component
MSLNVAQLQLKYSCIFSVKESGSILLQTIPGCMDIDSLKSDIVKEFPSIENIHEVHIWCLTSTRVYATAHIVLPSHDVSEESDIKNIQKELKNVSIQQDYVRIKEPLMDFFHKRGVTQATIQPEFFSVSKKTKITGLWRVIWKFYNML